MDLHFGWRNLSRNLGFSALVILTLALGIGATTTMFSAVWVVLLRPLPLRGLLQSRSSRSLGPERGSKNGLLSTDYLRRDLSVWHLVVGERPVTVRCGFAEH